MNRKKQAQTELSYYGLYLLNHLRENRFPQACDADFIRERADHAAEVYEQARRDALFADAAQELAMSALLKGLRFSKYSILYDVVDREFPLEVAVEDQEAFVKHLLPLVDNVYSIYDLTVYVLRPQKLPWLLHQGMEWHKKKQVEAAGRAGRIGNDPRGRRRPHRQRKAGYFPPGGAGALRR